MSAEFEQLFHLSVPGRLQLVQDLWDSIAAQPETVPVPQWQKEELARRKAEYLKNPDSGRTWDEVQREILGGDA
jgi:putative addiction module component (TIGR02574 family)